MKNENLRFFVVINWISVYVQFVYLVSRAVTRGIVLQFHVPIQLVMSRSVKKFLGQTLKFSGF